MEEKYYPCIMHNNELHILTSDNRYHKLSTSLKWVGWKRYERARQEAMKSCKTYKALVLSSGEIKKLFDDVYGNDNIYFDDDKRKAVYDIVNSKFLN